VRFGSWIYCHLQLTIPSVFLLDASKEVGLEVETVHMSLVRILMAVFDISHELEGYLLF
jgi:hypothetical protein